MLVTASVFWTEHILHSGAFVPVRPVKSQLNSTFNGCIVLLLNSISNMCNQLILSRYCSPLPVHSVLLTFPGHVSGTQLFFFDDFLFTVFCVTYCFLN